MGWKQIRVATSYVHGTSSMENFPNECFTLESCDPSYDGPAGWSEDISSARTFSQLPTKTQSYLRAIEELAEIPLSIVSVGPGTRADNHDAESL